MSTLTHVNQQGEANMVDVTEKQVTQRTAVAEGYIYMSEATIDEVINQSNKKGDVITIAKIAGIQGAKKCADLIPLCHPLALTKVELNFDIQAEHKRIRVEAMCKLSGKTGVEMEALTAVSVACLTLFDMCKAMDPEMEIQDVKVLKKSGGKSSDWSRTE